MAEAEAAAGAHNSQPTNGSDMVAETAFTAEAVATAATAAVQMVAVVTAVRKIYIKKGQKRR